MFAELDRSLIERCLGRRQGAWEEFVDRFAPLAIHVVNHSVRLRGIALAAAEREDLVADVFLAFLADDMAVLRRYRGESSLATYLSVVARRVAVRKLLKRPRFARLDDVAERLPSPEADPPRAIGEIEELEHLLAQLDEAERRVVQLYHLEGKNYQEIGREVGVSPNSVGPTLSRARGKLREAAEMQEKKAG